jgi:hypothetical protein
MIPKQNKKKNSIKNKIYAILVKYLSEEEWKNRKT